MVLSFSKRLEHDLNFFVICIYFIEVQLIYSVVLVSGIKSDIL